MQLAEYNDIMKSEFCEVKNNKTIRLSEEDYYHHIRLLIEAEFVVGQFEFYESGEIGIADVDYITWKGYEFLDSIKDENIWSNVKSKMEVFTSLSAHVIKELAAEIAKKQLLG